MTIFSERDFVSATVAGRSLLRRWVAQGLCLLARLFSSLARLGAQVPAGDPVIDLWPVAPTQVTPTLTNDSWGIDPLTTPFYDNWRQEYHSGVGVPYDPNSGMYSGAFRSPLGTGFPNAFYATPASSRTNGYIIRFRSDSPTLVIGAKEALTIFRLIVDGKVVAAVNNPVANGHLLQYTFDFGSSQDREFQILADYLQFQGIHVQDASYSITALPDVGPRAVFIGDSISEGGVNSVNFVAGRLLGWTVWNLPWGATGYIEDANGTRTNFYDRSDEDIIRPQPEIVVISGGINDCARGYSNSQFQSAVEQLFDKINAELPGATKIAVGPFWPNGSPIPELLEKRDIVQAVAAAKGFHFINWVGWITGDSRVPNSGNANVYIQGDNTHPSGLGRNYLGARLAAEIAQRLGQPVPGTLDSLSANGGPFTPAFSPPIRNYQLSVPYSTAGLVLTPTAAFPGTTVEASVNGGAQIAMPLAQAGSPLPLAAGANTVDVKVAGRDGMIVTHYTLQVTRMPASSNADLHALQIPAAELAPEFEPETTSYDATVASTQTSVVVIPTPEDANALVSVTGGGTLFVGENPVAVHVTAEDGLTEKTYAVNVTRPQPPLSLWKVAKFGAQATNPAVAGDLASPAGDGIPNLIKYALGLEPFTAAAAELPQVSAQGGVVSFTYTRAKDATDVACEVEWSNDLAQWSTDGVTEEVVPGSETPTMRTMRARIPSGGALSVYVRLRVARLDAPTNAGLLSLQTSAGVLSPAFNPSVASYTVNVGTDVTSFILTASVQDPVAVMTVTGGPALAIGANTFTVRVTAEDGVTSRTYIVTVNRAAPPPSIAILSPEAGVGFAAGEAVALSATATDWKDSGPALTSTIQWSSNLNGPLGTGGSISVGSLSIGTHTITASVTSSSGVQASATVTISVVASIVPPLPGSLVIDFDSTQGVSLSGANVTAWSDLSGRQNHLAPRGSPRRGVVQTPTGRPAISLNGNGDVLARTSALSGLPSGNANRTMFVVARYNSSTAWAGIAYGTAAANQAFGLYIKHPTGELGLQGYGGGNDLISTTPGIGAGWLLQSGLLDGGNAKLFKDGVAIAQFAHNYNTAPSRFVIGQELANLGYVGVDVAAVLLYDRALSATERAAVEGYLRSRFLAPGGPNTPPAVSIISPLNAGAGTAGEAVALSATAVDAEDDDAVLTGSIVWKSDRDGTLGTGGSLTALLSEGTHVITATVQDSRGALASASVVFTSFSAPAAPFQNSLVLHLDSTQGVSAAGGKVSAWNDLSGRQNHLIAGGAPRLGVVQTPAARPAITLNGNGDKLEKLGSLAGLPAGNADRTMFVVAKYNSSNAWAGIAYGTGASNQAFGLYIKHPTGELGLHGWGYGNDLISATPGIGAGWLVQSGMVTGGTATLFKDGAQIAQFAHNYNTVLSKLVVGAEIANLGYVGMDVAAVLVYDRALNAIERASVEEYLRGKFIQAAAPPPGFQLAQAYAGRLAAAGYTMPAARMTAFANYIQAGISEEWWDHLVDVHPYEGSTVAQASVKLKGSGALAPTGFANNHILANGGLQGGAGRYFDTGVSLDNLPFGTGGIMLWLLDATAGTDEQRLMGTWGTAPDINLWKGAGTNVCNATANGALTKSVNFEQGLWRVSRQSTTLAELSHNSVVLNRQTAMTPAASTPARIFTFNAGNGAAGCLAKIGFTAIDDGGMTPAQEAAHFRALARLMDDLGRISRRDGPLPLILVTGQSLAQGGAASTPSLTTAQPYGAVTKATGVLAKDEIFVTSSLLAVSSEDAGGFAVAVEGGRETPATAMATQIAGMRRAASPGSDSFDAWVGNFARGATAYSGLRKGTNPYQQGVDAIAAAARASAFLRRGGAGEAMVASVHGNSDTLDPFYYDYMARWHADYLADLGAITGQTALAMLHSQPSSWSKSGYVTANSPFEMLRRHRLEPAKHLLVCPMYFLPHYSDGIHLTNVGTQRLGEYYGKAAYTFKATGSWSPLKPDVGNIALVGNVITVPMLGAVGPLVLDTTAVSDPNGTYGFEYLDNSGAPPPITNVAISGSNVVITLASAPTGEGRRIRYAASGVPGNNGGPTTGPRGCLRDSDPALGDRSGAHLYNWCVHFDDKIPGASFSPLDIPDCKLWLRPEDLTGSDNDLVGGWTDRSGWGNSAVQTTAASKPLLKVASIGGRNALYFDGANDYLRHGYEPGAGINGGTTFVVCKLDSGAGVEVWDTIYNRRGQGLYALTGTGGWGAWCNSSFELPTNDDLRGKPAAILCQSYDSIQWNDGTTRLFKNGVQYGTTGLGSVSTSATRDVGGDQGAGRYFKGWIAEVIDYDRQLSDADRIAVENYLKAKYGL